MFLQQRLAEKFSLQAQVLDIRREDVEIDGLRPGGRVSVAAKTFSPLIFSGRTTLGK